MPNDNKYRRVVHRGDVFTTSFDPVQGSKQGKKRPAVVIQNDIGNRYSRTVIVAPFTTGEIARYDVNVEVKAPEAGLTNNSLVLLNQIRVVDKARLGRYWGRLKPRTMDQVDEAILISLGLEKYLRR
ncbi:MAG TPA: type II toxin-antitoxin system PemK/MazF family toxin [Caldilineae bacterium]|nr:type II toxin-antitoxin system PemK/MazF family toxin [Caldilineae bacterium]